MFKSARFGIRAGNSPGSPPQTQAASPYFDPLYLRFRTKIGRLWIANRKAIHRFGLEIIMNRSRLLVDSTDPSSLSAPDIWKGFNTFYPNTFVVSFQTPNAANDLDASFLSLRELATSR
ncbi:hypothetical protein LshimejAT787_0903750 [Lyophyllum shimeji]|uniref:Uncharacterized protein n=1 Tax=Lyophyllum shimeji TaxID=47721 RepID=A0A9P3PR38_LYOSH|nr:hypothetical protein LshimejAT787_0903750 [Lyophyllum shimeji]